MFKKLFLALVLAITVQTWSNLQVETVLTSNPFLGNKFTIINLKPIVGDGLLWLRFGEKKLEFNGCNEDIFSGAYTIK